MYNYRLINTSGDILGVVSLETEDLPNLLIEGEKLILSASVDFSIPYTESGIAFVVTPEPARETAFDRE